MKEPILSREKVLKIVRKTLKENNDRDKLSSDRFVALASAFEEALLEKLCGEPYAYELTHADESQELAYAGYMEKYATDEERAEISLSLYALNRSKA